MNKLKLSIQIKEFLEKENYIAPLELLKSNTGEGRIISPTEPDINFWNDAGFYYLKNGKYDLSSELYSTLYKIQIESQKLGKRIHKGMALHNWGISLLNFGKRPEAKKLITLAYIEDSITSGKSAFDLLGYKTLLNEFKLEEDELKGIYVCSIEHKRDLTNINDPEVVYNSFYKDQQRWMGLAFNADSVFLNLDYFNTLLTGVRTASTNDEKKNSLESLSENLFSSIRDFAVLPTTRTRTSEIDRIIRNYSTHPFLRQLGNHIIVECKNWSVPAGVGVIRELHSKIREHRCVSGILLSKSGVTGTDERDAWALIRDCFKTEGVAILVLTEDDLDSIGLGENPLDILEKKYEAVKFM